MALNRRQTGLYGHTLTFYGPVASSTAAVDGGVQDRGMESKYTGILGKIWEAKSNVQPTAMGRADLDSMETLDTIHVDVAQVLKDGWYVLCTDSPGDAQNGQWWVVQGDQQKAPAQGRRNANYAMSLIKKTVSPL